MKWVIGGYFNKETIYESVSRIREATRNRTGTQVSLWRGLLAPLGIQGERKLRGQGLLTGAVNLSVCCDLWLQEAASPQLRAGGVIVLLVLETRWQGPFDAAIHLALSSRPLDVEG